MAIPNSFVDDSERIATEASKLGVYSTISSPNKTMTILNSFVNDIFECIATEASKLGAYSQNSTISSRQYLQQSDDHPELVRQ
jgi:hypothetical protein